MLEAGNFRLVHSQPGQADSLLSVIPNITEREQNLQKNVKFLQTLNLTLR